MDAIRNRHSVRTYSGEPLSAAEWEAVRARLDALSGEYSIRLALLKNEYEGRQFGTYGIIRRPAAYMLAVCGDTRGALLCAGSALEKAVLECTAMGLGSCWLAGFKRAEFESAVAVGAGERIPAVVALGRAAAKPSWLDGVVRSVAKADRRVPFGELFFDGAFDRPLAQDGSPRSQALEMVRLGPSASNKQPWRVVWDGANGAYHFCEQHLKGYQKMAFDMQMLDMGIAMTHFEIAMREQAQPGGWRREDPGLSGLPQDCEYIVSWMG